MEGLSCHLLVRSWHGRRHGEKGFVEFESGWGRRCGGNLRIYVV